MVCGDYAAANAAVDELSVWQTKEGHRTGKHSEPQYGVGFLQ